MLRHTNCPVVDDNLSDPDKRIVVRKVNEAMKNIAITLGTLILLAGVMIPSQVTAEEPLRRLFFLHHSTGRYMLQEGEARAYLENININKGTNFTFWDHDYNYIGLSDNDGDLLSYSYSIPDDNTYPDGLHELWTTSNSARDSIMSRYDVIAFKSCYPASDIGSEAELAQYKLWYLDMRDFFDQHPEKLFIIMSPPPRHRLATNTDDADRAREFANWLGTDEYMAGHTNMVYFDFFTLLAQPDDGSSTRNMLLYDYEKSHTDSDSHPNSLANQDVAPLFMDFMVEAATPSTSPVRSLASVMALQQNFPNPFNPSTEVSFTLENDSHAVLDIFDIRGKQVLRLADELFTAGMHHLTWNGTDEHGSPVSSGLYFYRLETLQGTLTRKMTLVQ
jgi:hypothetical protein